ncbi:MAG TPA: hypothetical protein DGB85_05970, partial [Deltaproteobacteria bacterium]|nr:hypothetical protein [Deltaproteobacteria bacterium]
SDFSVFSSWQTKFLGSTPSQRNHLSNYIQQPLRMLLAYEILMKKISLCLDSVTMIFLQKS